MTKGSNIVSPIHIRENVVAPFTVRQKTFVNISAAELVMEPIESEQMIGDSLRRIMFCGSGLDKKRPVTRLSEKELARELLQNAVC